MKITKAKLKQIIKEELSALSEHGDWFDKENETRADKKFRDSQEAGHAGESVMAGYPGELKLYDYLEEKLGEKLTVELMSAVRLTDEDTQDYIMKLASEMIVSEGRSSATEGILKEHAYASNLSEIIELGLRAKKIEWEGASYGALPKEIFEVIRANKEALAPLDIAINHLVHPVAD